MSETPTTVEVERFVLFVGAVYYPCGGWGDFESSHATAEAAELNGYKVCNDPSGIQNDWFQVIDLHTGKEVAHGPGKSRVLDAVRGEG